MFEPFPGNYIWSLSVNIALSMGGEIGELDIANRKVMEAARQGADAGTRAFFDAYCEMAEQVATLAAEDEAKGRCLSALSTAEQKSAIRRRKTRPSCYMPGGVA